MIPSVLAINDNQKQESATPTVAITHYRSRKRRSETSTTEKTKKNNGQRM